MSALAQAAGATRPFDVVVWGATGFTGRLVCEHIARDYQGKVRWAMAGRDKAKLEEIRAKLAIINPAVKDVPCLIADAADAGQVGSMLKQTRVVLAMAGPYSKYGDNVVAQCVEQGTHYCDITGELPFVKKSIELHHQAAEAKGVRVVHCCGYDSVPSDLGALMMVDYCRTKLSRGTSEVYTVVQEGSGGISGGTIASAANMVATQPMSELKAMGSDQYYLAGLHGKRGSDSVAPSRPTYNPYLKTWTMPFVMEGVNARVVHCSAALARPSPDTYGSNFRYTEYVAASGPLVASIATAGMGLLSMAMVVPPLRNALTRYIPAGSGPSEPARLAGHWKHGVVAVTEGPQPQVVYGEVGDPKRDPGYWSTSRMILEAGLCMILDADKLAAAASPAASTGGATPGPSAAPRVRPGGVLTPASAFGMVMVERLQAAGFVWRVDESKTRARDV